MANTVSEKFPLSTLPLIPKKTIDPFSTAAIFMLYNVLPQNDRFGIIDHKVVHQPSSIYQVPFWGELDYNSVSRTIYQNSREETSDFVIAILESVCAYLKVDSFKKSLPHLKTGIERYALSYGTVMNNATTSFHHAITIVMEASIWKEHPQKFESKYAKNDSEDLKKIRAKLLSNWSEDEISYVINGIFLAISKKNKSHTPEINSILSYLDAKQEEVKTNLIEKLSILHKK